MATAAAISTDPRADWLADAAEAIAALAHRAAQTNTAFTADDLRAMIGEPDHPNWIGAAFSTARSTGQIKAAGYTTSRARSRHGGVIRRWRATV